MSGARERILASLRASLGRGGPLPESIAAGLEARIAAAHRNVLPAYDEDPVERFVAKLEAVHGRVTRVADLGELAAAVAAHLAEHDLGHALLVAPDPALDAIPWPDGIAIERRAARGEDRVSVTAAFAGVAETGTVVMLSGPESPTTLNFLPEDHLVVLRASRVVRYLEDVWARLRAERRELPRTVNFISGPSKTADVEQTLQEGAHGPRRLHVLLLEG